MCFVFAEPGLGLVAGAGGRTEAFQSRPGAIARSPAKGPWPDPLVSLCFLLLQGGEVASTDTLVHVRAHAHTHTPLT